MIAPFEAKMVEIYPLFNVIVLSLNIALFLFVARRVGRGLLRGIAAFLISFPSFILVAAICVIGVAFFLVPNFGEALLSDAPGAAAWSLESAIEFALPAIVLAVLAQIVYLIASLRGTKATG